MPESSNGYRNTAQTRFGRSRCEFYRGRWISPGEFFGDKSDLPLKSPAQTLVGSGCSAVSSFAWRSTKPVHGLTYESCSAQSIAPLPSRWVGVGLPMPPLDSTHYDGCRRRAEAELDRRPESEGIKESERRRGRTKEGPKPMEFVCSVRLRLKLGPGSIYELKPKLESVVPVEDPKGRKCESMSTKKERVNGFRNDADCERR